MSIVPILTAKEIIRVLLKAGFKVVRQRGSHVHLEHTIDSSRITQVVIHSRTLPRGTLMGILRQAGISTDEFLLLLGKKK